MGSNFLSIHVSVWQAPPVKPSERLSVLLEASHVTRRQYVKDASLRQAAHE